MVIFLFHLLSLYLSFVAQCYNDILADEFIYTYEILYFFTLLKMICNVK